MGANCGSCDKCGKPAPDTTTCPDIDAKLSNQRRTVSHLTPIETSSTNRTSYRHLDKPTTKPPSSSEDCEDEYDTGYPSSASKYLDTTDQPYPDSSVEPPSPNKLPSISILDTAGLPSFEKSTDEAKQKAVSGFTEAVYNGNERMALYYIEEFPDLDLLSLPFENDANCLQIAVKNLSYKLAYYLLIQGISPNIQNPNNGDTALHTAVKTRDLKMVTLLSKYLADPKIKNKNLETAITIAKDNNDFDIIELLAPETQKIIRQRLVTVGEQKAPSPIDGGIGTKFNYSNSPNIISPTKSKSNFMSRSGKAGQDMPAARPSPIPTKSFGKLKRDNTRKMLDKMGKMADNNRKLPILEAWLEKKSRSMGRGYQKRWVMVRKSYLLWSDVKRDIKTPKDIKERMKFNNSINLISIKGVQAVTEGKTQRKFTLIVETNGIKKKEKVYLWKCATKQDRDFWVDGLRQHISQIKSMIAYLEN